MPAPRVSQKLLGGPRGTLPRALRSNEIDPSKIGSITLNRDAIQALTIAQAKVQVTISAGGTTAILVSEETGRQIGGLDDLAKLLGLRSFVAKEKKASASSDVQEEILTAAFRVSEQEQAADTNFKQKKLDNSFVVAARPLRTLANTVNTHVGNLNGNYHEESQEYGKLLQGYCVGITDAIAITLGKMVRGEKEKGVMESSLLERGVPTYVRNKLQLKSLAITKDMDLSRILFPQDPSKGLSFTLAEWRSGTFVKKQGFIMRNNEALIRILNDNSLVQELVGMTAVEFANKEDPRVQRVMKTRILVVPPFADHKRVLEPLSRSNFRGFGLPQTAMDASRDRLSNLCAVFIRAYAFSVRMAETIPDFFDRITPVGTIKAPDDKLGNYAKQLLDSTENKVEIKLLPILQLTEPIRPLMEWIDRECKIIPGGDLHKKIEATLSLHGGGTPGRLSVFTNEVPKARLARVDMISAISTGTEKDKYKAFQKDALSIKDKSARGKKTIASSVLSKKAKTFLKTVARDHSPMLAVSMEAYFRGFYSEDIQSAAVKIAEARFDDLDDLSEIEDSSDDSEDETSDAGGADV